MHSLQTKRLLFETQATHLQKPLLRLAKAQWSKVFHRFCFSISAKIKANYYLYDENSCTKLLDWIEEH